MLLLMLIQTESHRLLTRGVMGLEQTVKGTAVVIMLHKKAFGMLPRSRLSFGVLPDCRELKLALCSFLAECSGDEHSQILLSFTVTQQVCWSWWGGSCLTAVWCLTSSSPVESVQKLMESAVCGVILNLWQKACARCVTCITGDALERWFMYRLSGE